MIIFSKMKAVATIKFSRTFLTKILEIVRLIISPPHLISWIQNQISYVIKNQDTNICAFGEQTEFVSKLGDHN